MQEQDRSHYFERRAEQERAAAECATNERAAQVHWELAVHYGELAASREQAAAENIEFESGNLAKDFQIVP